MLPLQYMYIGPGLRTECPNAFLAWFIFLSLFLSRFLFLSLSLPFSLSSSIYLFRSLYFSLSSANHVICINSIDSNCSLEHREHYRRDMNVLCVSTLTICVWNEIHISFDWMKIIGAVLSSHWEHSFCSYYISSSSFLFLLRSLINCEILCHARWTNNKIIILCIELKWWRQHGPFGNVYSVKVSEWNSRWAFFLLVRFNRMISNFANWD